MFPVRRHPTRLPHFVRTLAARSHDAVLLETARFDAGNSRSLLFLSPVEVLSANTLQDLPAVFEKIEHALASRRYVAGYLAYECGAHFALDLDEGRQRKDDLPLAWFGVYERPIVFDHNSGEFVDAPPPDMETEPLPASAVAASDGLQLEIDEGRYIAAIERIREYIAAGDTYQVNFTDAVSVQMPQSADASFGALLESQPVSYAALLNVAGRHILSLSPELFFRVEADGGVRRITTRPMKGTMPRGLDVIEDDAQAGLLASDEKNRSEHVMIVDLLRNDLGRICEMGSIKVEDLFTVERYRTLLQMTSTVSGQMRDGIGWYEAFRALFPSGSITGAPKIRTMQIIDELERGPRGIYTGSIGYIAPSGEAQFNVAIRTLVVNGGAARMGVGGGIVADSEPHAEYRECQLKASFLRAERPVFSLIETMRVEHGAIPLLPLHLDRLEASASYFDFAFDRAATEAEVVESLPSLTRGTFRLRLLLDANGGITLTHTPLEDTTGEVVVCISHQTVDSRDPFLRHKTTRREVYERELAAARATGFDEVLFFNERGELAEGAISTIFVQRDGVLLTPPLASGVLPGVFRRDLLTRGAAGERSLTRHDLEEAEGIFLGNAVRGLRRVKRIEDVSGMPLSTTFNTSFAGP